MGPEALRRDLRRDPLLGIATWLTSHLGPAARRAHRPGRSGRRTGSWPKPGTSRCCRGAQTAGIDLPHKLLVWEDAEGQVHVTYNDPGYIAARHGLTGQDQALHALSLAIEDLVVEAVQTRP